MSSHTTCSSAKYQPRPPIILQPDAGMSMLRVRSWVGVGGILSLLCIFAYVRFVKVPAGSSGKTYIITLSYGGQMTRAIRNLMVQQCWAGSLGIEDVAIVEPFSVQSHLVHKPKIWNQQQQAARFSDYYNLGYYNERSVKHRFAPLIPWEDFLSDAPRDATAISIPTQSCSRVTIIRNCTFAEPYRTFVSVLAGLGFNVVKKICLLCSTSGLSYKLDFAELLLITKSKCSIFVDGWRNYGFFDAWMKTPDYCQSAEKPESSNFLIDSTSVIHHSSYYIDHFIRNRRFIAIMLRIERFLTLVSSGRSNDSVESCLTKTKSLFDEVVRSHPDHGVYVTVDIGQYGSGVMKKGVSRFKEGSITAITKSVESFFGHVYNSTVTLGKWEDSFINATGGISERGYIAMVQRSIACQADCLILMGGGSFQQVAGVQYLGMKKTVKSCLFTVCVLDSFKTLFN